MKQVLVASSVALASQLGLSLKVPASLVEVDLDAGDCFSYTCGKGYVPKLNHHEMKGSSNSECCQPTCEMWSCTGHYVANDAYKGNIGNSNEQCCDKTCAALKCPKAQKVPLDLKDTAGMSPEECCKDTCAAVVCEPFHVPIGANKRSVYPDGEEQSFCCEPTCQAYTCDFRKGLTLDPAKKSARGVSDAACCTATCSQTTCRPGFKTRPENANKDAREVECCEPLCSSHSCGTGWASDETKANRVGSTDEECCQPTCSRYTCPADWAKNPAAAHNIGVADEVCCAKTCALFQDQCVGDYAPNHATNETVAQTAEKCCSETCALHSCVTGVNIPNGQSVVASSDELCCEDSRCPELRKMTKVEIEGNHGCGDSVTEEECPKLYIERNNTETNKTAILACTWTAFGVCQPDKLLDIDCAKA